MLTKVTASATLLALALFTLLLVACNGDSNGDDGDGVTPQATVATPPADEPTLSGDTPAATAAGVTPAASVDACALVTQAEAESALGAPVGEPEIGNTPPIFSCSYETAEFDVVSVIVAVYDSAEDAEDAFQLAIDINDYPEIEGLGERAYNGQPVLDVTVLTGSYELSVDVVGPDNDLQLAQDLARAALDRLP
jgi:hypothetical protein